MTSLPVLPPPAVFASGHADHVGWSIGLTGGQVRPLWPCVPQSGEGVGVERTTLGSATARSVCPLASVRQARASQRVYAGAGIYAVGRVSRVAVALVAPARDRWRCSPALTARGSASKFRVATGPGDVLRRFGGCGPRPRVLQPRRIWGR